MADLAQPKIAIVGQGPKVEDLLWFERVGWYNYETDIIRRNALRWLFFGNRACPTSPELAAFVVVNAYVLSVTGEGLLTGASGASRPSDFSTGDLFGALVKTSEGYRRADGVDEELMAVVLRWFKPWHGWRDGSPPTYSGGGYSDFLREWGGQLAFAFTSVNRLSVVAQEVGERAHDQLPQGLAIASSAIAEHVVTGLDLVMGRAS